MTDVGLMARGERLDAVAGSAEPILPSHLPSHRIGESLLHRRVLRFGTVVVEEACAKKLLVSSRAIKSASQAHKRIPLLTIVN